MTMTATRVEDLAPIDRTEASKLAIEEFRRARAFLADLTDDDWRRPTDCPAWDVRALAAHVLGGGEAFASVRELAHQMRAATAGQKQGGVFIDVMTALQVDERSALTRDELLARLDAVGPKAGRFRRRFPFRRMSMKEEVGGQPETWRMAYLLDRVLNRDIWMHRVDLARATDRPMELTADHDGRIVADAVADWADRHGRPFTLHLEGAAGGEFRQGEDGEDLALDAVEFCRILSERAPGEGLLAQPVPF